MLEIVDPESLGRIKNWPMNYYEIALNMLYKYTKTMVKLIVVHPGKTRLISV